MFLTEKEYQTFRIKRYKSLFTQSRIYKIPDVNMQIKPFDIIICANWISVAIELKICNLKKWLTYEQAYKMLRPNQIGALNAHQKAWWFSHIHVYNIWENMEYWFEFKLLEDIDGWEL